VPRAKQVREGRTAMEEVPRACRLQHVEAELANNALHIETQVGPPAARVGKPKRDVHEPISDGLLDRGIQKNPASRAAPDEERGLDAVVECVVKCVVAALDDTFASARIPPYCPTRKDRVSAAAASSESSSRIHLRGARVPSPASPQPNFLYPRSGSTASAACFTSLLYSETDATPDRPAPAPGGRLCGFSKQPVS